MSLQQLRFRNRAARFVQLFEKFLRLLNRERRGINPAIERFKCGLAKASPALWAMRRNSASLNFAALMMAR